MFNIGDRVKILSVDDGDNDTFIGKTGIIDKINHKDHYCYHVMFFDSKTNHKSKFYWWSEENVELTEEIEEVYETIDISSLNKIEKSEKEKFPTIIQAVLFLIGLFGIGIIAAFVYDGIASIFKLPLLTDSNSNGQLLITFVSNLIAILIGVKKRGTSIKEMFNDKVYDKKIIRHSIILLIGWWCIILPLMNIAMKSSPTLNKAGEEVGKSLGGIAETSFGFIYISLVGPFMEEIIFRGVILKGLLKNYKPGTAIFVSALLFGIFHMNLVQSTSAFGLGLIIASLYVKTGSLRLCFLIHCLNNTFVGIVASLIGNNPAPIALGLILMTIMIIKISKYPNRYDTVDVMEEPQTFEI